MDVIKTSQRIVNNWKNSANKNVGNKEMLLKMKKQFDVKLDHIKRHRYNFANIMVDKMANLLYMELR